MVSIDLLKQVSIFSGLSDEQLARIAGLCREETHDRGDVIVREKEPSTDLYVIQEGSAQVSLGTPSMPGPTPIVHLDIRTQRTGRQAGHEATAVAN